MLSQSESALICDLAETYHVLDYRALPVRTLAALAAGLPLNARVRALASDGNVRFRDWIDAASLDALRFIAWSKTEDSRHNQNRPESVLKALTKDKTAEEQLEGFDTVEELMERRRQIMEGGG